MNLIFRRYFSCILFSAYFCSFVPTNSEAATLRQKLISGATQIYSKILGRNSNTNLCQDIFSNQVLDSDIPRVSDDLKQALRNYLKLYYVQKNQNLSPMVVSQAFRQLALQASKEGFTQEQIMNLKKDLVQNNYADVIFPHQELHEFVALSEIEEGTPTETKTSFHHLFSIANESSNALQLKTNAIKLVPPEELTFTEASKKFPKISLPLTPYNIYGDSHIYRTLPDNLIPSLKFHRHPSLHANIFEAETFLHVKNQPDVLYIKPKTWIVGNLNDSRLIAWSQLNDTILTEISHGINSMDSLALTDTKFYFQLTDNSSDTIIFVYLFHTDIGLKVGQSKLKIISHREISMLPLIPIQSSELKILVQNMELWIQNYNSLFNNGNHKFRSPILNQRESRSWHYYDPVLRKIYLLFLPYNYSLAWFKPSEKIVRFIDISLEDGTMTDIPLPPLNADETSKISYRYNPSEIHHYQSDYFEFTLSYMEAQPSALSIDKTQKIQLFRRSSIGPPLEDRNF